MKKIVLCFILITLIVFFAACNNASVDENDTQPDTIVDPVVPDESNPVHVQENENDELIYTQNSETQTLGMSIIENFAFPEMYILEKDEIKGEYGVDTENIDDVFAAVPMEYPGIERVFIAKIADKTALDTAKEQLSANFDTIKAEYIDYLPNEYKKAKDVEIYNENDLLILVISEDYDSIISFINQ